MYINKITIEKFRVLENIEVSFNTPTSDSNNSNNSSNAINVIAGINGSGKTSLLEAIKSILIGQQIDASLKLHYYTKDYQFIGHSGKIDPSIVVFPAKGRGNTSIKDFSSELKDINENGAIDNKNGGLTSVDSNPRLIYSPAKLAFEYQQSIQLDTRYHFYNEINAQSLLGNAEYFIQQFVLTKERQSRNPDPKERTQQAIAAFNQHFESLDMATVLYDLDNTQQNKPIFNNAKGDKVTIQQLSDGEKQLYGRVVSLMLLQPNNSIILLDEPEISLHPAWQLAITKIYEKIGQNNQFIIATHSPQIIANTPYQQLILLNRHRTTEKIQAIQPLSPPSGIDVNSILKDVMATDAMPMQQEALYKKYRNYVETKTENSKEAQAIRKEILKRENENSEFLQEMTFMIALRDI